MLLIVTTMAAFFCIEASALSLSYSGSSSSNSTGATATTSGFTISYENASSNICGYRFSIVTTAGTPKSGTKVANIYISELAIGDTAYFSGQRFVVSSGIVANKKQLANGTKVTSSTTTQSCDFYSSAAGFYSAIPQAPSSIGTWIKSSSNGYQNLQRIYYYCGSNLANATASDYVLIEPIFWLKLANVRTAATTTELAIYGASVSGGDQYKGTDGNLYNAGSGTLWNLSNYINREFPNALYVSANTDVYSAVSVITSGKYTYKQIIGNGYGCSVLTVKNVITINTEYTNTIGHWAWGFNGNGNNNDKTAYNIDNTSYKKGQGVIFYLDESYSCKIPNGFYLKQDYVTNELEGKWVTYPFGTAITQPAKSFWVQYNYNPIDYSITYDLKGGTNNSSNPSTYNVLYGVTLNNPTKTNAEFLGWDLKIKKDATIPVASHNWCYSSVLYDITPGIEYTFNIDTAQITNGASDKFTCLIYDFTASEAYERIDIPFGNDISFSITCPNTLDTTHDLRILLYAGLAGSTKGNAAEYKGITIEYSADGVNKGCGSAFSGTTDLYDKLSQRITGDVIFTANWEEDESLIIVPIEPNAAYRLSTDVVTSYWVVNCNADDILPDKNVSVLMTVYDGEDIIYRTVKKNIVIPANDKNLVYFKWGVPDEVAADRLTITSLIMINYEKDEPVSAEYAVTPYTVYSTPDTQYKKKAPSGFSVPYSIPETKAVYARWWEYKYEDGTFTKVEYGLGSNALDVTMIYSESKNKVRDRYVIKSGYPFSTAFNNYICDVSGYTFPDSTAYTDAQYINVRFPEFGYRTGEGFSRTLFYDGQWQFRQNNNYGNVHFIPLYYPNGEYYVVFEKSDLWTPAGMIKSEITSAPLVINGNAYSDWYINHR